MEITWDDLQLWVSTGGTEDWPEYTHTRFRKGCVEVRRDTDEENIGEKDGYRWGNVMP